MRGTCSIVPSRITRTRAISYYTKGALVALALDLKLRLGTRRAARRSTTSMRELWRRYGARGIGVPEDGFEQLAAEVERPRARGRSSRARVRGTEDPPLQELLAEFAYRARAACGEPAPTTRRHAARRQRRAADARGRAYREREPALELTSVLDGGAAERAGLEPRRRAGRDRSAARQRAAISCAVWRASRAASASRRACSAATSSRGRHRAQEPRRSTPATCGRARRSCEPQGPRAPAGVARRVTAP